MIQKKLSLIALAGLLSTVAAQAAPSLIAAEIANSPSNYAIYKARAQDFKKVVTNTTASAKERQMLANVLIARSAQSIKLQTNFIGGDSVANYLNSDLLKIKSAINQFQFQDAHSALNQSWTNWISQ